MSKNEKMIKIKNQTTNERIYYICKYYNCINYIILNKSPTTVADGIYHDEEQTFEVYDSNDYLLARYSKASFENPYTFKFKLVFDKNETPESMFEKMKSADSIVKNYYA